MAAPLRPEIVCLCGSLRFADELAETERALTLAGAIVLAPVDVEPDGDPGDDVRARLGALHRRRIDLADRVLVVNPGGYVGNSVRREIAYAHASGKRVDLTDPGVDMP